jgi:hypothetical protein
MRPILARGHCLGAMAEPWSVRRCVVPALCTKSGMSSLEQGVTAVYCPLYKISQIALSDTQSRRRRNIVSSTSEQLGVSMLYATQLRRHQQRTN